MALVARVVDFTVGAMAFVEEDDLDVVLMLHRPAAAGGGRGGQGAPPGGDRRASAAARPSAGSRRASSPRRGARHGAEETALGGFASFPIVDQRPPGRACSPSAARPSARIDAGDARPSSARSRTRRTSSWRTAGSSSACSNLVHPRQPDRPLQPPPHHGPRAATSSSAWAATRSGVSLLMVDIDHFKRSTTSTATRRATPCCARWPSSCGDAAHGGLPGPLRRRGVRGHPAPHGTGGGAADRRAHPLPGPAAPLPRRRERGPRHRERGRGDLPCRASTRRRRWSARPTRPSTAPKRRDATASRPDKPTAEPGGARSAATREVRGPRTPLANACECPRWLDSELDHGYRRPRARSRRRPRPRDGAAARPGARAGRRVRRPLLRAPPHLVAPARGRDHPHGLRRASPAASACGWWPASAPATPTPTTSRRTAMARAAETAAHIAADTRTLPPQAVAPAPVDRRYGADTVGRARPRRPHRPRGARRPRRPGLRPAHREGRSPPWATRPSRCASPTPPACWPRTCSRSSPSASP